MAESPSSYGTLNGGECFAEHFSYYFCNPTWLKHIHPEGYDWMNKNITYKYNLLLKNLIRSI